MKAKVSGNNYTKENSFVKAVTAIYGLNLALSYENAAVDRLERRVSKCIVPAARNQLKRHLKQTKEQQKRLKERIELLSAQSSGAGTSKSNDDDNNNEYYSYSSATIMPTTEHGRLPIPEPPDFLKAVMDEVGTDREREVWESVNDLIVERAEAIMYRAGISALDLLRTDKKTIGILKTNLREEEAFARWLEKNNPRIAKKLMKEQMHEGRKGRRIADIKMSARGISREGEEKRRGRELSTKAGSGATAALGV